MPPAPSPATLFVIAGPNGSGKSTLTRTLLAPLGIPILDPDAVAKQINPTSPDQVALEAGRQVIALRAQMISRHNSFAQETTLAGGAIIHMFEQARASGFVVDLIFVSTASVEINLGRIADRVASGGHNVPEEDVRRRYTRSLENLPRAVALADRVRLYDNSSTDGPVLVLDLERQRIVHRALHQPAWLVPRLPAILAAAGIPATS
jgi:predicted ABC-type ATPase